MCTLPDIAPDGYVFGSSAEITGCYATDAGCDASGYEGINCATGYSGTPALHACISNEDTDIILSGCRRNQNLSKNSSML